jgi:putative ABC transport system ATP-binding protein
MTVPILDAPDRSVVSLAGIKRIHRTGDVEVRALDGIDLEIAAGEFVAIMGPSGSGKSSLMNILGCLDRPTSGDYLLDGRSVCRLGRDELAAVRNRTLGFVFQSFNLLARTTALENVELPLIYMGIAKKERRRRAREALERVGLEDRLEHRPNQLSGGQQQRVAIARALVSEPKLLLADEPTGNLDSKTSADVMALFGRLAQEGITTILVTHEPDIAAFARRVIVIRDGRIASDRLRSSDRDREQTALRPLRRMAAR